jgi:choline dehydrogenase
MASHDFVVVGAGSAGCVLANRLSADGASVLLIESGGTDRRIGARAPAAFPTLFQGPADWNYLSEPEPGLYGRRWYLPRGRMLGGSSSMNAMLYVRGHRSVFDQWASEDGATGWGYDDVLPYFRRSEDNADIQDEFHGVGGELHITRKRWLSKTWEPFIEAAVAAGIERTADCNGAQMEGVTMLQTTTRAGRRLSSSLAFLKPVRGRDNLEVVTDAHVRRVVIEGGRAVGVEYVQKGKVTTARAGREVIVSAGSYASPQLLMLSGIGPAAQLREHGVEVLVDSPQVGENLQEHPMAFLNWRAKADTLDDAASPKYLLPWLVAGKGKLSSTVAEAAIHWRSDPSLSGPDFQILQAPVYFWEHGFRKTGAPAFTLGAALIAPTSRGRVTLRSSDPEDHPRILNNALSEQSEVDAMLRAIELCREIAAQQPLAGILGEELNPSRSITGREQLEHWLRATCEHEYHPTSTCRIGGPDEGVVDPELRVHGVEGLRIADSSVMPRIVSANTHAATVMIAERCAEFALGRAGASTAAATPAGVGA